jgi:hypothetical protein
MFTDSRVRSPVNGCSSTDVMFGSLLLLSFLFTARFASNPAVSGPPSNFSISSLLSNSPSNSFSWSRMARKRSRQTDKGH